MKVISEVEYPDGTVRRVDDMTPEEKKQLARKLTIQMARTLAGLYGYELVVKEGEIAHDKPVDEALPVV